MGYGLLIGFVGLLGLGYARDHGWLPVPGAANTATASVMSASAQATPSVISTTTPAQAALPTTETPMCQLGTGFAVNPGRELAPGERVITVPGGVVKINQREAIGSSRIVFRRCVLPETEVVVGGVIPWVKACGNDIIPEGWTLPGIEPVATTSVVSRPTSTEAVQRVADLEDEVLIANAEARLDTALAVPPAVPTSPEAAKKLAELNDRRLLAEAEARLATAKAARKVIEATADATADRIEHAREDEREAADRVFELQKKQIEAQQPRVVVAARRYYRRSVYPDSGIIGRIR